MDELRDGFYMTHRVGSRRLDYAEIVRLYHDEGLDSVTIGQKLGCSPPAVRYALRKSGRPPRPRIKQTRLPKKYSGEWLQEEIEENE